MFQTCIAVLSVRILGTCFQIKCIYRKVVVFLFKEVYEKNWDMLKTGFGKADFFENDIYNLTYDIFTAKSPLTSINSQELDNFLTTLLAAKGLFFFLLFSAFTMPIQSNNNFLTPFWVLSPLAEKNRTNLCSPAQFF